MNKPKDPILYKQVKDYIYSNYPKHSAYRSGMIVKMYKELGGQYIGDKLVDTGLTRWFKEEWVDINPYKTDSTYPVYRPTKRITKDTPLTIDEIPFENIKKQSKLKQKIKDTQNLPKFKKK